MTNYSKGLSNEVGPKGIRANTVAPGFIETTAAQGLIERLAKSAGTDQARARQGLMDSLGGENHFEADASLQLAQADGYQKSDVRVSESRTCTPSAKLTK